MLLVDENPRGTFLVRPSEHNPRGYSLSVKDWEDGRGHHVKHYKIKPLDNGGFFIATNQTFPSLPALVMAYSSECPGLFRVQVTLSVTYSFSLLVLLRYLFLTLESIVSPDENCSRIEATASALCTDE